ncbi:unnamed protein product [Ixodes hexagonus]
MAASIGVAVARNLRRFRFCLGRFNATSHILSCDPLQQFPGEDKTMARCSLCGSRAFSTSPCLAAKKMQKPFVPSKTKPKNPVVKIWRNITLTELANVVQRPLDDIYEAMLYVDNTAQYDHDHSAIDDIETIFKIVRRLGYRAEVRPPPDKGAPKKEFQDAVRRPPPEPSQLVRRPPVVTIMGHVDHGKTTLLDSLRSTNVVDQEFGGITQHIGAFTGKSQEHHYDYFISVTLPGNERITFLDTPGHAAFSAMRARGALATDIVVLVVAADDGVMEQTVESIRYAREADVPIIVAINKVDKPNTDIEHVKRGLIVHGIQMDDEGGDVQYVCISALKGTNLDKLTETILTQAELMEIQADPKGMVEGVVIESTTDKHRGKLSTALIQRGTLKKGSFLVAGKAWAKVRAMFDEWGKPLQMAPPGVPAQVIGWKELPSAGDDIIEVESEKRAREVVEWRQAQQRSEKDDAEYEAIQHKLQEHLEKYKAELDQRRALGQRRKRKRLSNREKEYTTDDTPRLPVIMKGDVDGSVEAVLDILDTYHSHRSCRLDLMHYGVGAVTESDVELAQPFNAVIYAFHVPVLDSARRVAEEGKVDIRDFRVIYHLVEDIRKELGKRLPLIDAEEIHGEALVLQEFLVNDGRKKLPVAGCRCTKGALRKDALFKVCRDSETIHTGSLSSMRHLKNEVDTIKKDVECGLMFQDSGVRFQHGDVLVCFSVKQVPQESDWDPGF